MEALLLSQKAFMIVFLRYANYVSKTSMYMLFVGIKDTLAIGKKARTSVILKQKHIYEQANSQKNLIYL